MSQVLDSDKMRWCGTTLPSFPRRGGRDLQANVAKPPHSGADGMVDKFDNRNLKTTPSAPLRNGTVFLLAQLPLLGKEGSGVRRTCSAVYSEMLLQRIGFPWDSQASRSRLASMFRGKNRRDFLKTVIGGTAAFSLSSK